MRGNNIVEYILVCITSSKNIPKPHNSLDCTLHCGLDLTSIVSELNILVPQLSNFVEQFNNLIIENSINVISDTTGNLEIEVPQGISDAEVKNISKRIGILDRLIIHHRDNIEDLLKKGFAIEKDIKSNNSEYVSVLTNKIEELKKLKVSYKHA